MRAGSLRALRVSHSSVVTTWRQRDREMRARGTDVRLVVAKKWDEGGSEVAYDGSDVGFTVPVAVLGRHPNLFAFDPRPLWRIMKDGPWDVIDFHEEPYSLAMAELLVLRALRARGAPFLVYSAQNLDKRFPAPFRWIERRALAEAAGAYVCNAEAGRILRRKGLRGELRVIPLGVDVDRFRPSDRSPPEGTLRVGYVGRLAPHKGVDVLLEAVAHDPCLHLELIGSGPDADRLAERARRLGVSDRARFRGFTSQDELPGRYRDLDVLAVPSVPTPAWTEQFCRVAVEAMASGVPVVASDTGALPEVVGDAGLLVAPGDPVALRLALRRVVDEPGLWARLRAAGLARVGSFTWATVAEAHLDLYKTVAKP